MDLINGSIGETSRFHGTFGYYAHGIPPESCPLPSGWDKRLNPLQNENTNEVTGLCLGPEDLACSKRAAGRPKDLDFVEEMIANGIVEKQRLRTLILDLPQLDQQIAAQRSLQIVEHRIRFSEISSIEAPDTSNEIREREKDRSDDLSL